jgi:hypothetical protein
MDTSSSSSAPAASTATVLTEALVPAPAEASDPAGTPSTLGAKRARTDNGPVESCSDDDDEEEDVWTTVHENVARARGFDMAPLEASIPYAPRHHIARMWEIIGATPRPQPRGSKRLPTFEESATAIALAVAFERTDLFEVFDGFSGDRPENALYRILDEVDTLLCATGVSGKIMEPYARFIVDKYPDQALHMGHFLTRQRHHWLIDVIAGQYCTVRGTSTPFAQELLWNSIGWQPVWDTECLKACKAAVRLGASATMEYPDSHGIRLRFKTPAIAAGLNGLVKTMDYLASLSQ